MGADCKKFRMKNWWIPWVVYGAAFACFEIIAALLISINSGSRTMDIPPQMWLAIILVLAGFLAVLRFWLNAHMQYALATDRVTVPALYLWERTRWSILPSIFYGPSPIEFATATNFRTSRSKAHGQLAKFCSPKYEWITNAAIVAAHKPMAVSSMSPKAVLHAYLVLPAEDDAQWVKIDANAEIDGNDYELHYYLAPEEPEVFLKALQSRLEK